MIRLATTIRKNVTSPRDEFDNFFSRTPKRLSPNNPVIVNDGTYENTCPAGIITNPANSAQFIFYLGEFFGSTTVGARITYYIGSKSDPYTLGARQGVVLAGSESYDTNGCRFGHVEVVGGTVNYYYVGVDASFKWRICRATSSDGITFTKQGVVLDYNDTDEKSVSDPSIIIYNGTWYMTYTGWDGATSPPNNNPGQSKVGIKVATSSDGITWVKNGTVIIPLGASGAFDDNNVEGGQLLRVANRWAVLYNCNDGSLWYIMLAYTLTDDIDVVFTKRSSPYFRASNPGWDSGLVACPYIYDFGTQKVFYYQALSLSAPLDIDTGAADIIVDPIN